MGIFNKYPYTDMHELNLDWIVTTVKDLAANWETTRTLWNSTQEAWNELHDYVMNYFNNLDVQDEINNKITAMVNSGEFLAIIKPYLDAEINNRLNAQDAKIEVLKGRMDTFASLTEGSTTGDAELQDIRVMIDGQSAPTAGDAVRSQVSVLKEDLTHLDDFQNDKKFTIEWEIGGINQNGTNYETNKRIRTTNVCYADADLKISVNEPSLYQFAIARFDDENMTNPRYTWWVTNATLSKGMFYRVSVRRLTEVVIETSAREDETFNQINIQPFAICSYEEVKQSSNLINTSFYKSENIWNQNNDVIGRYANGEIVSSAGWITSEHIKVKPNTTYVACCVINNAVVGMAGVKSYVFDGNFKFTSELPTQSGAFTTGINDEYVRLSTNDTNFTTSDTKMLVEGNKPNKYIPYLYLKKECIAEEKMLPEYYESALLEGVNSINNKLSKAGKNKSAIVFLTDVHWNNNEKHSPYIVKHILDNTEMKYVVCGGDVITRDGTKENAINELSSFQKAFDFCKNYFFNIVGNHDHNNNNRNEEINILSDNEMYYYMMSQSESPYVVWGDYYCYYVDNSSEKTRYLFCDTGWYRKWNKARVYFMVDALKSLDDGWKCVFITHTLQDNTTTHEIPQFVKAVLDMLDHYNSRTAYAFSYANYGMSVTEDGTIDYDFSDAKGYCKLVIGGHTHEDNTFVTDGGIRCLVLDCDSLGTVSGNPSTVGTVNEQCVSVIIANYDTNKVDVIRIGRGNNAEYDL